MKSAARYLSYRCLFWTILSLAFFLPFLFITTALVTLEGVHNCTSLGRGGRCWVVGRGVWIGTMWVWGLREGEGGGVGAVWNVGGSRYAAFCASGVMHTW
jgi:hypothetical protein